AGWLLAIRRAHARVHAGLDVRVPILVGCSAASYKRTRWHDDARSADSVLDVDQIARWTPALGMCTTLVRIEGGLHDLALSPERVRKQWFAEPARYPSGQPLPERIGQQQARLQPVERQHHHGRLAVNAYLVEHPAQIRRRLAAQHPPGQSEQFQI